MDVWSWETTSIYHLCRVAPFPTPRIQHLTPPYSRSRRHPRRIVATPNFEGTSAYYTIRGDTKLQ